jgi:Type II secretory pathway, pullulanase PulA and related glycosidases
MKIFSRERPNELLGLQHDRLFRSACEYSSSGQMGQQVAEFKAMVRSLHAAGIEVILDVVYNHTAEGNHLGPTLCFRGIDNLSYYWLHPENSPVLSRFQALVTA